VKRDELKARMREIRERVAEIPAVKAARARRKRRNRIVFFLIALLLGLLVRCDCGGEPPPPEPAAPEPVMHDAGVPKTKPPPFNQKVKTQHRGAYGIETPAPPPWLDEFMLQVTARSPRLAQCFTGSDRPGVLRWTASVNARNGVPSDHELELVGGGNELKKAQRDCVLGALSSPPYKLTAPDAGGLPDRVSVVLEF
jgi:hypothetical protein